MENVLKIVGGTLVAALLVVFACIAGAAGGAFTGWIVSLVWPHTTAAILAKLGMGGDGLSPGLQFWQFGLLLGFAGAFFRSSLGTK